MYFSVNLLGFVNTIDLGTSPLTIYFEKQARSNDTCLKQPLHDKVTSFPKVVFTGCGCARTPNQACLQDATRTQSLGMYELLWTAHLSLIPPSPRFLVPTRATACQLLVLTTLDGRTCKMLWVRNGSDRKNHSGKWSFCTGCSWGLTFGIQAPIPDIPDGEFPLFVFIRHWSLLLQSP